jgi:hypothetical protein
MIPSDALAARVSTLRLAGRVEVPSYDQLVAIQAIEPRAEVDESCQGDDGQFTLVCRPMTIDEAAASRGILTYDTALPEAFIAEISALAGDPRRQIVWCYDNDLFGSPAAITAEGERLLALYHAELRRHLTAGAATNGRA